MRDERVPVLPDVQSAAETAHPGLHYDIWNMMLVPKGVPAPVVRQLNDAVNRVLASPAVQQRYAQMGVAVPSAAHRSTDGAAELLQSEVARWRDLLARAGIQAEGK